MKKYIFLFISLVSYFGYSQNDEKKITGLIDRFSEELMGNEIDTFFYSKRYCMGQSVIFQNDDGSMCFSNGTYYEVYFFWKDEEQVMMKKLDNCGSFMEIQLKDDRAYEFFIENVEQLRNEEVKGYAVKNPENVPAQRSDVFPCYRAFSFTQGADSFKKEYNLFDLTNESKYENIHYKHNKELRVVDLDQIVEALIMKSQSKFKREKK